MTTTSVLMLSLISQRQGLIKPNNPAAILKTAIVLYRGECECFLSSRLTADYSAAITDNKRYTSSLSVSSKEAKQYQIYRCFVSHKFLYNRE